MTYIYNLWYQKWAFLFLKYQACLLQTTQDLFNCVHVFLYQMCGFPLEIAEQHMHSYLGVCLHHRLSRQPHIDFICNKANRLLHRFLYGNLKHCLTKLKECAYKHLILLILDYFSSNWDPYQHKLFYETEMIQHQDVRFVSS